MKRIGLLLGIALLLAGCTTQNEPLQRGLDCRSHLLAAQGCRFEADITADYGDSLSRFSMACETDSTGALTFVVMEPEAIAGIGGTMTDTGGALVFDDTALHFDLLADEQLTPVSGPWILIKTLRSGYLTSACMEGELLRLTIQDSYEEDALQLDIWLDQENFPVYGDILYDGYRILTMEIKNYALL